MSIPLLNTHHFTLSAGRHKGQLITRVPISYLKWMVQSRHSQASYAQAELDRRGITTPTLDITIHAVDRASEFAIEDWRHSKEPGEGFYSWLIRMATMALSEGTPNRDGSKIIWNKVGWVFDKDGEWPVLKTVMPWRKKI